VRQFAPRKPLLCPESEAAPPSTLMPFVTSCFLLSHVYSSSVNTILEIESAVQKLPLSEVRALQDWIENYVRDSETSTDRIVADTWEKLGPAPDLDYDKI